jgi:hypothetical protein
MSSASCPASGKLQLLFLGSPAALTGHPTSSDKESSMYRLMKSEKFTLDHLTSGPVSFYRQTQVKHFRQFRSALGA